MRLIGQFWSLFSEDFPVGGNVYEQKILITEAVDPAGITLLQDHGYQVVMGTGYDEETLMREAHDADGVLTRNGHFTERVLNSCPKLQVIGMHGAGVDCIDVEAAERLGIQVTNAADANSGSVAEFTLGLILSLAKKLPQSRDGLRKEGWSIRPQISTFDLEGKTLGVLGMGRIGTAVARKASYGFGMKVLGYRRNLPGDICADYGILTSDLDKVIRNSDFLSIHLPYTKDTFHLVSREKLELMKSDAYLLNLGRGELVDQAALRELLLSNRLAGAALDVFEGEIPDADDPLLHMDQVIATPHIAGLSKQAMERLSYQAALGITEVLEGRKVTYPVNHPEKYASDVSVA